MRAEGEVVRFPIERVEARARFDEFVEDEHERTRHRCHRRPQPDGRARHPRYRWRDAGPELRTIANQHLPEGGGDAVEERDRVVVALVERYPRRGRLDARQPLPEQHGLPVPGWCAHHDDRGNR